MARDRNTPDRYSTALGRLMLGALVVMLLGLFLLWRIDSPRVERLRMEITDRVIPNFSAITAPVTAAVNILRSARSYTRIYQQNQELRRELQQMKAWKEAALQREQENARLLDLNNVRLDPKFTKITGVVLATAAAPSAKRCCSMSGDAMGSWMDGRPLMASAWWAVSRASGSAPHG